MDPGPEFATNATYGYFDNRRLICSFRCSRTRLYNRCYSAQFTCLIEEFCLGVGLTTMHIATKTVRFMDEYCMPYHSALHC